MKLSKWGSIYSIRKKPSLINVPVSKRLQLQFWTMLSFKEKMYVEFFSSLLVVLEGMKLFQIKVNESMAIIAHLPSV